MTRDELLGRLVGRRGPGNPDLGPAWQRLAEVDRERLRATATDPTAASHLADEESQLLVDALAAERAGQRQRDTWVPVLTGLLVLATLWGFGRAAFPRVATGFLLAGLTGAALATVAGWRARARTRAAARRVREVLRG